MPHKKPTYKKETYKKETYGKKKPCDKPKYASYNTVQQLLAMFEIDLETGRVTCDGEEPSTNEEGYLYFKIDGMPRPVFCHKLIWMKANMSFVPFKRQLHHINHNKLDNRLANLQCVTKREHEKIHGRRFPNVRLS